MEILTEAPKASAFVPLAEHQSATPASFYDGPAVLHYYSDRCKLIVLEHEANNAPALANLFSKTSDSSASTSNTQTNGHDSEDVRKVLEDLDVWVTSDKLFIFSTAFNAGLSISYPTISLHAIQSAPEPSSLDVSSQGLYMQLISTEETFSPDDPEPESISITIIPTASGPPTTLVSSDNIDDPEIATEGIPEQTPVAAMFAALSTCSNLHPDPVEDEEMGDDGIEGSTLYQSGLVMAGGSDGDLPPPMPGSGGWITAENMHEFIDENGNWIEKDEDEEQDIEVPDAPLGPGAGTTRTNDSRDADGDGEQEAKWRRTD